MAHSLYHSSVHPFPVDGASDRHAPAATRGPTPRPPCCSPRCSWSSPWSRGRGARSAGRSRGATCLRLPGRASNHADAAGPRRRSRAIRCGRSPRPTAATSRIDRYVDALDRPERRHRRPDRSGDPSAVTAVVPSCRTPSVTAAAMNRYRQGVQCPICHADDTKVVDSRVAEEATAIRRRRECLTCAHRFTTFERVDHATLTVVKSHGGREPFDRKKVVSGLIAATTGRSVSPRTARSARRSGRGVGPAPGVRGVERQRRPRRARGTAHARRGRLSAVRQRVQGLRCGVGLPPRARTAAEVSRRRAARVASASTRTTRRRSGAGRARTGGRDRRRRPQAVVRCPRP